MGRVGGMKWSPTLRAALSPGPVTKRETACVSAIAKGDVLGAPSCLALYDVGVCPDLDQPHPGNSPSRKI